MMERLVVILFDVRRQLASVKYMLESAATATFMIRCPLYGPREINCYPPLLWLAVIFIYCNWNFFHTFIRGINKKYFSPKNALICVINFNLF